MIGYFQFTLLLNSVFQKLQNPHAYCVLLQKISCHKFSRGVILGSKHRGRLIFIRGSMRSIHIITGQILMTRTIQCKLIALFWINKSCIFTFFFHLFYNIFLFHYLKQLGWKVTGCTNCRKKKTWLNRKYITIFSVIQLYQNIDLVVCTLISLYV